MDQIEELIKEIAVKHGIAVGRDDPILVLQTINQRLMQDTSEAQRTQLDQFKEELEGLALRWGTDAKVLAERVLNASLTASKEVMGKYVEEGAKATANAVKSEIDGAVAPLIVAVSNAGRVAMLNVIASCIALAAAGVSLWVVLR